MLWGIDVARIDIFARLSGWLLFRFLDLLHPVPWRFIDPLFTVFVFLFIVIGEIHFVFDSPIVLNHIGIRFLQCIRCASLPTMRGQVLPRTPHQFDFLFRSYIS